MPSFAIYSSAYLTYETTVDSKEFETSVFSLFTETNQTPNNGIDCDRHCIANKHFNHL